MTILIIIAGIIALFFVIALVSGKQMKPERSIIINKPAQEYSNTLHHKINRQRLSIFATQQFEPAL